MGFLEGSDFITYQRRNFKLNTRQILSKLRIPFLQYLLEPSINFIPLVLFVTKNF